ncbi:MAG TPA: protein-L-isoaspartate(D-aspartate) O-methyltransferase, partial [Pirellulales bacterium]|nr:protein-L-isoaspartate(D-aspartate) O-methyltransferase [Pirellulales bacterium]
MCRRKQLAILCCLTTILAAAGRRGAGQGRQTMERARQQMVEEEIIGGGIKNPRVIEAMRSTPRHEFVPLAERKNAYFDMALPIGEAQTISAPFFVAYMTEQLDPLPDDNVLEIGTGSGFQAAVLSPLVQDVYTIEIKKPLGERAARTLKRLKYENVHTRIGDGYAGWPEAAPFDKIIVTCSPEKPPQALIDQLKEGGRMLIPLGERYQQTLYMLKKTDGKLVREPLLPIIFVPMTGAAEEARVVKPDPLHPAIRNGGFEETIERNGATKPVGWHYLRQVQMEDASDAPQGKKFITFMNSESGRSSQALQALPIDGRRIQRIVLSAQVRLKDVQAGPAANDLPVFAITFYDDRRTELTTVGLGPWRGTFDW